MSTITINLDNLTAEEQETVKRLAKKKKAAYWIPKDDEPFWYINNAGDAECGCCEYSIPENRFYLTIGNCFKTIEETEEAATKLKMQTRWKRLSLEAGEAENPWEDGFMHWYVFWDFESKRLMWDYVYFLSDGCICFPSEKSIKAAIAELGEENVKKYILGVNDGR